MMIFNCCVFIVNFGIVFVVVVVLFVLKVWVNDMEVYIDNFVF